MDELSERAARLAAAARSGGSATGLAAHVEALFALRAEVEAQILTAVGALDSAGVPRETNVPMSTTSWLTRTVAITRRDAADVVRTARLVRDHPRTARALAAGDLPPANAALLARAARHREPVFDDQEAVLLDAAEQLAPEEFRLIARRWQSLADDHLDRAGSAVQTGRWHLHASPTFGGAVAIQGLLDPEGGAIFLAALEAHDPMHRCRDHRPLPQRRADALIAMASGPRRRQANVDVVVDLATARGDAPTDVEALRREIAGIGPIGQATLDRLLCDCNIGRIIMRGQSLVLDLGRRTSVVSRAQRRALAVRDGGCVEAGCSAPPEWCDAHHTDPWTLGGPTDLGSLELRCRRHHLAVHEGRACARPPPFDLAA